MIYMYMHRSPVVNSKERTHNSDTITNQAVYARFVSNSQKGLWLIMHFDEFNYFNLCHML